MFLVINLVTNIVPRLSSSLTLAVLMPIVGFILSQVMALNLTRMAFAATNGEQPDPAKLFVFERLGPWILGSILFGLIVGIGLILFIVPGVIAYVAFGFWGFVFVDRNLGVSDSFSASNQLTAGRKAQVFVFFLVVFVLSILVVGLTLGLAAIITYPIAHLVLAHGYRTLKGDPVLG